MPQVPWQPYFPTPYQVPYFAWMGDPDNTDSRTGNIVEIWAPPVLKWVQGWDILTSEILAASEAEQKFTMFLMVPPDFWPGIRDRFGFPIPPNQMVTPTMMFDPVKKGVLPGIFEVTGHDVESYGMTGWQPGNIVLLKELT